MQILHCALVYSILTVLVIIQLAVVMDCYTNDDMMLCAILFTMLFWNVQRKQTVPGESTSRYYAKCNNLTILINWCTEQLQ